MKNKFLIIAGDNRLKELFILMKQKGKNVDYINEKISYSELKVKIDESNNIILPLPLTVDDEYIFSNNNELRISVNEIISALNKEQKVYFGGMKWKFKKQLIERDISFVDYLSEESFVTYNAYLTAQGALRLLLENTNDYLPEKRILITGFGRVAKAVAQILCNLDCDVYVAARSREQRVEAELSGCKSISTEDINSTIYLFDYIINTVPSNIFTENDISCMKSDSIYFELASAPYGVNCQNFENKPMKYISGAALPGRFCEKACAKAILNEII